MAKSTKSASPSILLLNGPNLNLLGTREPHLYGRDTLAMIERRLAVTAKAAGVRLDSLQTNHEGVAVDRVQARGPAGYFIGLRLNIKAQGYFLFHRIINLK